VSPYVIEPLAAHDRRGFACGSAELDDYFRDRIGQDIRRRVASSFVAIGPDGDVAGFYTLAATSLAFGALPVERARRLPRYPVVPAILLGRLAISLGHQGKRLGSALVADAMMRAGRAEIAGYAMLVEAKDEAAARFYRHLGFESLPDTPGRLIRPLWV